MGDYESFLETKVKVKSPYFILHRNTVEYNATVEHHPNSAGYASDVKVTWMTPPYIKFIPESVQSNRDILSDAVSKGVPQFKVTPLI